MYHFHVNPRLGRTRPWPGFLGIALAVTSFTAYAWAAPVARPIFAVAGHAPASVTLGPRSLALEIDAAQIGALEAGGGGRVTLPLRDGRTLALDLSVSRS